MQVDQETVVVITGASGGVGRATARLFADARRENRSCWRAGRKAWKAQSATSKNAADRRWPSQPTSATSTR